MLCFIIFTGVYISLCILFFCYIYICRFNVDKTTGIISVALCSNVGKVPCLDYETQPNYYLTYIATDDNGNGQSNSVTIMVMLIDSNDNPPIFMQHSYTSLIDEGVTTFEPPLVVQVNAID